MSDNQDYIEYIELYIISNHKKLTKIHAIHVCINRINNRLVLKDWYKLELQTSETMKSFDSTKNLREETNNGEYVPSLEVVQVVWIQYN